MCNRNHGETKERKKRNKKKQYVGFTTRLFFNSPSHRPSIEIRESSAVFVPGWLDRIVRPLLTTNSGAYTLANNITILIDAKMAVALLSCNRWIVTARRRSVHSRTSVNHDTINSMLRRLPRRIITNALPLHWL